MSRRLYILSLVLFFPFGIQSILSQETGYDFIFAGGESKQSTEPCVSVWSGFGSDNSMYKGGHSFEDWKAIFCSLDNVLDPEGIIRGGIYKGGDSPLSMVFVSCSDTIQLNCDEPPCESPVVYSGGASRGETLVDCGYPIVLAPEGETFALYKGGISNDLFVACLEKPAIIDVNLPMYQGSRSYAEIVDCAGTYQLGEATLFGGGESRQIIVDCHEIQMEGVNIFAGDTSKIMAVDCYEMPDPLLDVAMFRGGESTIAILACEDDIPLGEPTGGYFRGGESRDAAVFCYEPPCLDLEPSVISTQSVMPICSGKTVILTASPAASRKWQRYENSDWTDYAIDDEYIEISQSGEFRLVSFGSAEGCADTSAVFYAEFITSIPQPVITVEGTNVICVGGAVALRSSEAYQYLWSNGASTQTVWITEGGYYTVTITDENGCSATSDPVQLIDGTIAAPSASITPNGTIELCAGTDVELQANTSSAYKWSTGEETQNITVNTAGKYTVRITDENGCQATADSVQVIVHDVQPVVSHNGLTICHGDAVGLSLAPHTTGITWYKEHVSLGIHTVTIQVTETGTYYAVLDTLGCSFQSDEVTVISNASSAILANITASHPVLCEGGSVILTADEAESYLWSTGEMTQTIEVNTGATYTLSVEDEYGCVSIDDYTVSEVTVTKPLISIQTGKADLCPGEEVELTVTAGVSYEWATGETTQNITVSEEGSYTVQVTDHNGCVATADAFEVTVYPEESPVIEAGNGVICGDEPLTISVMAAASYVWSTGETTQEIEVTTAGDYQITITTEDGCSFTSPAVTVTKVAAPGKPLITSNYAITNDTVWICPNQQGTVTLESTTASFWYWSTGETAQNITPAGAGKFAVQVEYATTCSAVSDTVVIALKDKSVYIDTDDDTSLCPGDVITLEVVGLDAGSTVVWNNNPLLDGNTLEVSEAGTYFATVTGTGGCVETTDGFEVFTHPTVIPVITPAGSTDICPYDSLRLDATQGVGYLWSTGDDTRSVFVKEAGSYTVDVTDQYGCTQTSAAISLTVKPDRIPKITLSADTICQGNTVTLTAPGDGAAFRWNTTETTQSVTFDDPLRFGSQTYWVEVTYADGCTFRTTDTTIYVHKTPREPEITVVGSNNICPDLTVALIATKSDDYDYQWKYKTTETDNWEIISGEKTFGMVAEENGYYQVIITDPNGCSNSTDLHLASLSSATIAIEPPGPVSLCEKGWAVLTAVAGDDVTYKWTTGETTQSILVNLEGFYRVTATTIMIDEDGKSHECSINSPSVKVTNAASIPAPTITASGPLTFCEGGKVTLTSSLSPNGRYQWYKDETVLYETWRTLEVTEPGEYYVQITDNSGCVTVSQRVSVKVNPIPEANINPEGTITVCQDGTARLTANAGTGYTYRWSTNETTRSIDAAPGTYTVTVTANNCAATSAPVMVRLASGNEVAPMPDVDGAGVCPGEKTILTATAAGVTDPEFIWWNAGTDGDAIGYGDIFETPELNAEYDVWVSVQSETQCESPRRQVTVQVGVKVPITFATGQLELCSNDNPVDLPVMTSPAPAGGIFYGNGVSPDNMFNPQDAGAGTHYIYYAIDSNGCTNTDSIKIEVKSSPYIEFTGVPADICVDGTPFIINVSPEGGILSGTGVDAGESRFNPAVAGVGAHWIFYTYAGSECPVKDSVQVEVRPLPEPTITNTQTVVSPATEKFELTATPPDGVFSGDGVEYDSESGIYYFVPSEDIIGDNMVFYTVANEYGCEGMASIIITVSGDLSVDTPNTPPAVCEGNTLTLTVPNYDVGGGTLISAGWLLDGADFDPATPVTYADNGKLLAYQVITNLGTETSPTVAITVHAVPVIDILTPPEAVCSGSLLVASEPSYTERGAAAMYAYWTLDGDSIGLSDRIFDISDHDKSLRYVVVTACGTAESNAVAVSINPLPEPSISGALTITCANTTETYTVTGLAGNVTNYTYSWTATGGTIQQGADASVVNVLWTRDGADTLALAVTHMATGCTGITEAYVTVSNATPVISVTNPEAVCIGSTVDLASAVPVDVSMEYVFYENDQVTPLSSSMVTVNTVNAYYYVQATDRITGCQSAIAAIVVSGKLLPEVSFNEPAQDVCNGTNSAQVAFNSTIPGSDFAWTNDLPAIGLAASGTGSSIPSFIAINTGNTPVTATVTVTPSGDGCTGAPQSFTITVQPTPGLVLVKDTLTVCSAANLTSAVSADASVTYIYYQSDQTAIVSQPGNVPVSGGDTVTYYVQAQLTATGCLSVKLPVVVVGLELPQITVINPPTLCEGTVVNLTETVPVNASVDYAFYESDMVTLVNNPASISPQEGTNIYYVQATDKATGCAGDFYSIAVEIQRKPVAWIEAEGDATELCYNGEVGLQAKTDVGTIRWLGWYDSQNQSDNTDRFGDTHIPNVVYKPASGEIGELITLRLLVNDMVCGYLDTAKIQLQILPMVTGVDMQIVTQPQDLQEVCVDTVYQVRIKADRLGDLTDMELSLRDHNATQLVIKGAGIKQPYLAGNFEPLAEISSDITGKTWSLPAILEHGDSVLVQVTVAAECEFFSGTGLQFALNAKNMCGGSLPEITIDTDPYRIVQETATMNTYTITSSFDINKVDNSTSDTVIWRIEAKTDGKIPTDSDRESLVLLVPAGLTPVADSYNPIQNVTTNRDDLIVITDEFGVEFGIPVNSGLGAGDVMIAELKFTTTGAACDEYDFYVEALYTDSVDCNGTICAYHITRGGVYPTLEVERYTFSVTDKSYSRTVNELWYGDIFLKAETQFYAGDTLFFDFYVDRDNSSTITPGDTMVHSFEHLSTFVAPLDTMDFLFDSVYIEKEKQLLVVARGNAFCEENVFPLATIMGADTICRADTSYYYTVPGMRTYDWNVIKPDGISGATPVRIPLEGSTENNFVNEHIARIVWKKEGDYIVWAQYTLPDDPPRELSRTYFPVRVNERPAVELTGDSDTTVCEGTRVELSHFFRETTGAGVISFYRVEVDESLTFLSDQTPLYVMPEKATHYRAIAGSDEGCESEPVDFYVEVSVMAQIINVGVLMQPDCATNTGSLMVTVAGGSGSYEYNLDNGSSFINLPAGNVIENLSVGDYRVYIRDKSAGCPVSVSDMVSLTAANSDLYATTEVTKANNCNSNDGTIKLTVSGGTAPYQYQVNGGSFNTLPADGVIGTNFAAGTYNIIVKDAEDCTTTAGEVRVDIVSGFSMALVQLTPADCDAPGMAEISLSDGTPDYQYRLSGKGWMSVNGNTATIPLDAGLHYVYAMDANGCEISDTIRIDNTSGLAVHLVETTNAPCHGLGAGEIHLHVTGGAEPVNYSIDGGISTSPAANGELLIDVSVGVYQVLISDNNGCTNVLEGIRIERDNDFMSLSVVQDTIKICPNDIINIYDEAILSLSANVDTVIFFTDRIYENPLTDNNINQPGTYYIRAESDNGCFAYDSVVVDTKILPPVVIEGVNEACVGDRVILSVNDDYETYQWTIISGTGGTPEGAGDDYREFYTWSETGTKEISITVTDAEGCEGTATKVIIITPRADTGPIYRLPNLQ